MLMPLAIMTAMERSGTSIPSSKALHANRTWNPDPHPPNIASLRCSGFPPWYVSALIPFSARYLLRASMLPYALAEDEYPLAGVPDRYVIDGPSPLNICLLLFTSLPHIGSPLATTTSILPVQARLEMSPQPNPSLPSLSSTPAALKDGE